MLLFLITKIALLRLNHVATHTHGYFSYFFLLLEYTNLIVIEVL